MEKKTIGSFLSALRKANGMTQQEVADKLNVSNKTVSKWERDEGCPEIMMLPAIAELYSVTVDEILRGERIVKEYEEQKNSKSEERIKYLIEKASVKFTDCAIVSAVLGSVAFLLSYTVGAFISYNYLSIAYIVILVLIAASVTVLLVAFNNFTSCLKGTGAEVKNEYEAAVKKCIKYVTAVVFLTVVSFLGLVISIVVEVEDFIFIFLPATVTLGAFFSLYIRSLIYKGYGIEDDSLTAAQRQYRKRKIKTTAIILAVIIVASVLLPFICGWVETSSHAIFSFSEAVGYQYETDKEAEREYYKLKDFVTGKREMYTVISGDDCYLDENGKYVITVEQLGYSYTQKENSYTNTGNNLVAQEELYFDTAEAVEKFKAENVIEDIYIAQQRNITFDDETLTVSYQTQNDTFLNGVLDIMPAFIITGGGISFAVLIISVIIYYVNKKKIA